MGCHGNFSLDETTRRSWYNPEAILVDLKAGMTFADIGCGDGYFAVLAAKKVGAKGKVYAMDLHDFRDPAKVLFNAKEMLKPSGLVVDLDWKKVSMPFGPPVSIRFSEEH